MERKLSGGDYLPGSQGGVQSLDGAQALLQRVLFRLSALARQYTVQALESEEDLTVTDVQWTQLEGSRGHLQVYLEWQGEPESE